MSSLPLIRSEYWNPSTNTVRSGSTAHGESLTDMETYLLPLAQVRASSLHLWGVAEGLSVSAVPNTAGVTISPGVGLDVAGRTVVVAVGGFVVVDPTVDPNQIANIPTVPVPAGGVVLDTAGLTGDLVLTLTMREVLGQGQLANAPVLVHAPWLRLLAPAQVPGDGTQLVLAQVSLDGAGLVTGLTASGRRLVGVPANRLELSRPVVAGGAALTVDQAPAARLRVPDAGGVQLTVAAPGGPDRPVLEADPDAKTLALLGVATLRLPDGGGVDLTLGPADLRLPQAGGLGLALTDPAGTTHRVLTIDGPAGVAALLPDGGRVAIGLADQPPQRTLHTEGSMHSGGSGGGYSFADRAVGSFVEAPGAGERWVWYAQGGQARLWSSGDRLSVSLTEEGGGLDVRRRMRVRQGGDASAGIWFHQTAVDSDRAFVGMANDHQVGFYGATGSGWGLLMDTTSGGVTIGAGGLDVTGTGTAISGHGGNGFFASGVFGSGNLAMFANGTGTGLFASGKNAGITAACAAPGVAGQFFGNVSITGSLSKGGGGFTIDHPLDPENRYLSHSFVESPEMLNLYRGTVTTDHDGRAEIKLPEYFEALNRDPSCQLTTVGTLALATVTGPVDGNRFAVQTSQPEVTVSWLVIGVRQDPWATENRIQVESDKHPSEQGYFLHPSAHGQPEHRGVPHASHGALLEHAAATRSPQE